CKCTIFITYQIHSFNVGAAQLDNNNNNNNKPVDKYSDACTKRLSATDVFQ
ncbi:Hypothetical predicted protein, partial [Podarcis lilfordi]